MKVKKRAKLKTFRVTMEANIGGQLISESAAIRKPSLVELLDDDLPVIDAMEEKVRGTSPEDVRGFALRVDVL